MLPPDSSIIIERVPLSVQPTFIVPNFSPLNDLKLDLVINKNKLLPEYKLRMEEKQKSKDSIKECSVKPISSTQEEIDTLKTSIIKRMQGTPIVNSAPLVVERCVDEPETIQPVEPVQKPEKSQQEKYERRRQRRIRNEAIRNKRHLAATSERETIKRNSHCAATSECESIKRNSAVERDSESDIEADLKNINARRKILIDECAEPSHVTRLSETEERINVLHSLNMIKRMNAHTTKFLTPYDDIITPLSQLKLIYRNAKKSSLISQNVAGLKSCLALVFKTTEMVATEYLSINIGGFANDQMANIDAYEEMLYEISEKNYLTWSANTCAEMQLGVMFMSNLAKFAFFRQVLKK